MQRLLGAVGRSRRQWYQSGWPSASFSAAVSSSANSPAATSNSSSVSTANSPSSPHNPVTARYLQLVQSGALRHDSMQWTVVERLAHMYSELAAYGAVSQQYQQQQSHYMARKNTRLKQMEAEDIQAARHKQQGQQLEQKQTGGQTGASWASGLLSNLGFSSGPQPASKAVKPLTPEQQAKLASADRERRVVRELGPPPTPPTAPKGLYLWGSVGSGKSLVMDLFYEALTSHPLPGLQYHRRLHFNAAMLEVHSRLHRLDRERQDKQRGMEDAAGRPASALSTSSDGDHNGEEGRQEEGQDGDLNTTPLHDQGLFRYWTVDPESQRQKDAKAAFMAIRRHLMMARMGRVSPEALARSNSAQIRQVAAEFLLATPLAHGGGIGGDNAAGSGRGGPAGLAARSPEAVAATAKGAFSSSALSGSEAVQTIKGHCPAVLCFDEMQVSDVFSAVALKGLLEGLTAAGCVVVTTSNRQPRQLPRHGLHEDMFENLIQTLEACCEVTELSSQEDYRRLLMQGVLAPPNPEAAQALAAAWQLPPTLQASEHQKKSLSSPMATETTTSPQSTATSGAIMGHAYLHPTGPLSDQMLEETWQSLVATARRIDGAPAPAPSSIPVMFGRQLDVPVACGRIARFRFEDLCARPLGTPDYVALASAYHTVVITDVPVMSMQVRDQARRFINLIDELYNARVRLLCTAAAPPDQLFSGGIGPNAAAAEPILDLEQLQFETAVEGSKLRTNLMVDGGVAPVASTPDRARAAAAELGGEEERFAFSRAVSRLFEMQSPMYMAISSITRNWTLR